MRKQIVAGNWKMNNTLEEGILLIDDIIKESEGKPSTNVLKIICPPFINLAEANNKLSSISGFDTGAQNCNQNSAGAFTGEVSAKMISSTGSKFVLIGHSERRQYFNEDNERLAKKVEIALSNALTPIFCIGENLEERESNEYFNVLKKQLKESLFHLSAVDFSTLIIAYEPIWAIGTGNTATAQQVQEIHNFIRFAIEEKYSKNVSSNISILYGGSCNAKNAKELFACADVDGGLIGGASLKAPDFIEIANSF